MLKNKNYTPNLTLSILIPSFNDERYIKECLDSILSNKSNDFEVILNDDHSDDDTLKIAQSYNDSRLTCFLPNKKLGTVKNMKTCCEIAKGRYIFIVGSDDYITSEGIDNIIPKLIDEEGEGIVTAPMRCFSDIDNTTIDIQSSPDHISKIFLDLNKADSKNLLFYSNHDELIHAFFPRKIMKKVFGLASGSGNTVFFYWVLILFHKSKITCTNEIFLNKRYLKKSKRVAWNSEYNKSSLANPLQYIRKALKDLYNTFFEYKVLKDTILFLKLLLLPIKQIEKKGGFHGLTSKETEQYHLGTLPSLILSPFFEVYKIFKK